MGEVVHRKGEKKNFFILRLLLISYGTLFQISDLYIILCSKI